MKFRRARLPASRYIVAAVVTAVAAVLLVTGREFGQHPLYATQVSAAADMRNAMDSLGAAWLARFPQGDAKSDPNLTGLIGVEYSPTTTTLGDLVAKRTSTNPDFAALMVRWFHELRLQGGDVIAVGSSGSFPALVLATVCAAEAMGLRPIVIASLGASSFGANRPEWTILDMEKTLYDLGLIHHRSRAVSIGGENDIGLALSDAGRSLLHEAAARNAVRLISQTGRVGNVKTRAGIYTSEGTPKVFVNIGGAQINTGDYAQSRRLKPGINFLQPVGTDHPESTVSHFTEMGIPVIHLLHMEELALQHGLAIDPRPFPEVGLSKVYYSARTGNVTWLVVGLGVLCGWLILLPRRRRS